jgi:hypothetical protein
LANIKTIAFSIVRRSDGFIQQQKRHFSSLFAGQGVTLKFYDAKTHPLGDPALSVSIKDLNIPLPSPKQSGSRH